MLAVIRMRSPSAKAIVSGRKTLISPHPGAALEAPPPRLLDRMPLAVFQVLAVLVVLEHVAGLVIPRVAALGFGQVFRHQPCEFALRLVELSGQAELPADFLGDPLAFGMRR